MLLADLEAIDYAFLESICFDRLEESRTLDFKQELPGSSDRDKHEFLKDVCAFANAEGGDLVYGIAEDNGSADSIAPCPGSSDEAIRRLGQILDGGMEPRVPGVSIKKIEVPGGFVLILRVPSSFDGPHRYLFNNHSRFVMRNGTHVTELTYDQLRTAFDRTATLSDRARKFRVDRINAVLRGETWRPLSEGPICALHMIPLGAMAGRTAVDVRVVAQKFAELAMEDWWGGSCTFNLDGLVVHPGQGEAAAPIRGFVQVYRTGALEAIWSCIGEGDNGQPIIPGPYHAKAIRDVIGKFIGFANQHSLMGPRIIGCAMLNVGDHAFYAGKQYWHRSSAFADRPQLVLPEEFVETSGSLIGVDSVVRPMLDLIWQSFGLERCSLYDLEGNWKES